MSLPEMVFFAILAGTAFLLWRKSQKPAPKPTPSPAPSPVPAPSGSLASATVEELAKAFAWRLYEDARTSHVADVVENLVSVGKAQLTTIPGALPSAVVPHPASAPPPSQPPK